MILGFSGSSYFLWVPPILGGLIVGMIAGGNDPANAVAAGEAAGRAFGENFGKGIFLMSLVIAVAGSFFGWLPGTRSITT